MENEKKQQQEREYHDKMLNLYCDLAHHCNKYNHSNFNKENKEKINCNDYKFKCDYYLNRYLSNDRDYIYSQKSSTGV